MVLAMQWKDIEKENKTVSDWLLYYHQRRQVYFETKAAFSEISAMIYTGMPHGSGVGNHTLEKSIDLGRIRHDELWIMTIEDAERILSPKKLIFLEVWRRAEDIKYDGDNGRRGILMNISNKATAILLTVAFLIGIGLGAWGMHTWQVSDLRQALALSQKDLANEKAKHPVVVTQKGEVKTETQIAYVPKETVVYRDTKIGQEITSTEKTDLQATGKTNFNMLLNGKPVQFTKADDEKYIFDKNKITWDQTSTVTVNTDIRPMLEEYAETRSEADRSHFSAGGYISNLGAAVSLGIAPRKNIEYKVIATVPDTSKFRGAGVEYHF